MSIFALSDPHLSFGTDKPMSVFGEHWDNHEKRIEAAWKASVDPADTVILAGDISWATRFDEALPDLAFLDALPGRKVLLRGNHDYWWSTVGKMNRQLAGEGISTLTFLGYEAIRLAPGVWLAGSRGWPHESESTDWDTDEVIYRRELIRFALAFSDARKKMASGDILIAASHFCPLERSGAATPMSAAVAAAGAAMCLYGHVHNSARLRMVSKDVVYLNTAADVLDFKPLLIHDGRSLCI